MDGTLGSVKPFRLAKRPGLESYSSGAFRLRPGPQRNANASKLNSAFHVASKQTLQRNEFQEPYNQTLEWFGAACVLALLVAWIWSGRKVFRTNFPGKTKGTQFSGPAVIPRYLPAEICFRSE